MRKAALAVILGLVLSAPFAAWARDPEWSGLGAVAVSPDGKTIVAGGQNRVLYMIDAQTMEVKQRLWTGVRIGALAYNKDGTRIVFEDEEEETEILDAATLETVKRIGKAGFVECARLADLMAVATDVMYRKQIRFLSMTDGSQLGSVDVADKVASYGFNAEGTRFAVLTTSSEGKENKVAYKDVPKELTGLARKEFVQKNDGKTSKLIVFEAPTGKQLRETALWYCSDTGAMVFMNGETAYIINYSNENLIVPAEGDVKLFESQSSYNYAKGVSDDRKAFLVGGLATGTYTRIDGLSGLTFQIDRLRGWPEYFGGFAFQQDGTGWAVTSSCRLIQISKEGKFLKAVPVY